MKLEFLLCFILSGAVCYGQSGQIISDSIQSEFIANTITAENSTQRTILFLNTLPIRKKHLIR
jgi:hypothetical protein